MKALQQTLASYFAPTQRDTSAATRASAASRKVKSLLVQYPSIKVEKTRDSEGSAFWVDCPQLDSGVFATSWEEVLDHVETYVDTLTKTAQ
jgi:hypothetical protein